MTISAMHFQLSGKAQAVIGAGIAILGSLTMLTPFMTSIFLTHFFAIVIAGAALASIIYAVALPVSREKIVYLSYGLLGTIAAAIVYKTPLLSMYSITVIAICYLAIDGLFLLYSGAQVNSSKERKWTYFNALCSFMLAGLLIADWPLSGLYAVSMFVGIKLVVSGWGYAMNGFAQYAQTKNSKVNAKRAHQ